MATVFVLMSGSHAAWATHFRYGHTNWKHVGGAGSKTVEFTVQAAWRQDGVSNPSGSNAYRCVNPAGFTNQSTPLPTIPCTGPLIGGKYNPGVGDVFVEDIGNAFFEFGDGSEVGGPGGDPLLFKVTSADAVNNWVFGLALDPNSLPLVDTTIQHTYHFFPSTKTYTARMDDCCRISACTAPNAHMNNPDDSYQVETAVKVGSGDSSPVSSLPPIVLCPQNGLCSFQVPASDNESDGLSFRMSTTGEAQFTSQPGAPQCPNAASIDSGTGVYSWNTTGCRLASDAGPNPPSGGCGNSALNTLYSTQVMIEEPSKGTKTAVDFFIQLVPSCTLNSSPVFNHPPTPACGSTVSAHPNTLVSFPVQVSDPNAGDLVTLNAAGVPQGAALTPTLPTSGNPANATFSWTPTLADLGQHVVTFTATDPCGVQQLCSITVDVSQEICGDGIDNDGDGLLDCADPDCAGTPCDDGNACTANDTCSGGTCVGGPPPSCDDGNVCTTDGCDPGSGCTHTNNSDPCDDGNACTTNDTCSGGACVGGTAPDCDDGNACTADSCAPAIGCQHPPVPNCQPCNSATDCDDHNVCDGVETCSGGRCQPGTALNCDDHEVCTTDTCDPTAGCINTPNTNPCDDHNACTTGDTCSGGTCAGGAPPNCDDDNLCTDDTCDTALGCVHTNNTGPCSDGDPCTAGDTCSGGACQQGTQPTNCDDNNVCTTDTCDSAVSGGCVHTDNTAPCDDGDPCSTGDTCGGGTCHPGTGTPNCDDGNACTVDSCVPDVGCQNVAPPDCRPCATDADCDDQNICNGVESCVAGQCQAGSALNCDDNNVCTTDSCDPMVAGFCVHTNNALSCDDGNSCTTGDTCVNGGCVGMNTCPLPTPTGSAGGSDFVCGDGVLDPGEQCDDGNTVSGDCCASNCVLEPRGSLCDDGLTCTVADQCDGFGVCRGTPSVGDYAILYWPETAPPPTVMAKLGTRTLMQGHVCFDRVTMRGRSQVLGDVVGWDPAGNPVLTFAKRSHVAGSVVTESGGVIRGLDKVRIENGGAVDQDGVAPELDQCDAARTLATTKHTELAALDPSPGLDLLAILVKVKKSAAIPASGDLGAGQAVIRINGDLKVGNYATLTITGAPTTTKVIVHVTGKMTLRPKAKILLNGLLPKQVIFVVDGPILGGSYSVIPGTIMGGTTVTLGARNRTDGAVLAAGIVNPRVRARINHRPWIGWCD